MPDFEIQMAHVQTREHHVKQGDVWLAASDGGLKTAAISYAALEFRYAIERLAVQYLEILHLHGTGVTFGDTWKFDVVRRRIIEVAGHEGKINLQFEFMRIVLREMRIDQVLHSPQLGLLQSKWHECSAYCHVAWPLDSSVPEMRQQAFGRLTYTSAVIWQHVNSLDWPRLIDKNIVELRDRFADGSATELDVQTYIRRTGVYATHMPLGGGSTEFIGTAVPPDSHAT